MSKLTGNDAKNLMDAYNKIYDTQEEIEFVESEIFEEVNEWINFLLDEGYDLSEYTWEQIYEIYMSEIISEQQSDVSKQWERGARWVGKATDKYIANPVANAVRTVADYSGQAASGVVKAATGGSVDLEKIGRDAEKIISGRGGSGQPKPQTAKAKPQSGGVKVDLRFPSVQQALNPKWWAPDRPSSSKVSRPSSTRYRVDSSGRMVKNEEFEIEEQTRVRARLTKGGKPVFGSVVVKGGKPVQGSFKPATGEPEDIKKAEVEYNIARNEAKRRSAQYNPNAYFGTTPAVAPTAKSEPSRKPVTPTQTVRPVSTSGATSRPAAATRVTPRPAAPRAAAPKPPIEKKVSAVTGKPTFVGTVGGVKFERRAATRAELDAARAAREAAEKSGESKKKQELAAVKAGVEASKKTSMKEAFDIILDYLLSEGHVESLEEALYVMMEMDSETIQSIVEASPLLPGESGKAPSSGYKEPILPGEKREMKYMKKAAPGQTQKLPPA